MMENILMSFDWKSFWINIIAGGIFFLLSIPLAIKIIPFFTIKQLNKKNNKYIVKKFSSIVQEICEYINDSPFCDSELNKKQISIYTKKNDVKNYRFVTISKINVFNTISLLKIKLLIYEYFEQKEPEKSYDNLKLEMNRLEILREKLEKIIGIHSLYIDDQIISDVSDLCLDIRSFEIRFKYNDAIDDLIEAGKVKRDGVFGVINLADLYGNILLLLKKLLSDKYFDIE